MTIDPDPADLSSIAAFSDVVDLVPGELVDDAGDSTRATDADVRDVERASLRRQSLVAEMAAEDFERVVTVTYNLIERRFSTMQKIVDVSSSDVNINPFLMLAMAPAYNIFSPFEAAEYTQNAKMYHGDATAFGKFVELNIFRIFAVKEPLEKKSNATLYSAIDAEITVEGQRYLTTWKSGPWTMNQSHANEMVRTFPEIHDASGLPIILGIFYGTPARLNNKPAMVTRGTGAYFHVLVGKELWEFVTGVENAHLVILRAIREAQSRFALAHEGKTFYEHVIEARLQLAQSFRQQFDLIGAEDDMWEMIFKKSF